MSAFIPDQLDNMSKKDLLEFARTAHEENVKLSKRVKELESAIENLCVTYYVEYDANSPANTLEKVLRVSNKWMLDPSVSSDAAEFALEQKCLSISELSTYFVNRANREEEMLPIWFPDWCNDFREQLRKEQE